VVDDREAGAVEVEVGGRDLAAGESRADRPAVQHPREAEIVEVPGRPAGLGQALFAGDAATHHAHGR
jgi:hypothetical protein